MEALIPMRMKPRFVLAVAAAFALAAVAARAQTAKDYAIHDRTRPLPPVPFATSK